MKDVCLNSTGKRALAGAALVGLFALTTSGGDDRFSNSMFGGARIDARSGGFYDHFVPSTPENVTWGEFPSSKPPVVVIRSGDIVRIDTLSHAGATQGAAHGR